MSSDIKLTDDEGLTLQCERILPVNSVDASKSVNLAGSLRLVGSIRLTPWSPYDHREPESGGSTLPILPSRGDDLKTLGKQARVLVGGILVDAIDAAKW